MTQKKWILPRTVVDVVMRICADYDRRRAEIEHGERVSPEVRARYVEYNYAIDVALAGFEGEVKQALLKDIYLGRGYDRSPAAPFFAKNTYYTTKHKIVWAIAKGLLLI